MSFVDTGQTHISVCSETGAGYVISICGILLKIGVVFKKFVNLINCISEQILYESVKVAKIITVQAALLFMRERNFIS